MADTESSLMLADARNLLLRGTVIPAHPLALTAARSVDEQSQRALTRYYVAAGAGGIAVGVHTTGFQIHNEATGLYRPVLELAAETAREALSRRSTAQAFIRVAGLVGHTAQARREATIARELGYDCGLLSPGALRGASNAEILAHCRHVAEVIPLFGFYLQPAVGGMQLDYNFWRSFAEIPQVVAIKIAPFSRYATVDVVRAVADAGRDDIALYTGNDDSIIADLTTPFAVSSINGSGNDINDSGHGNNSRGRNDSASIHSSVHGANSYAANPIHTPRWITGGLLGQWAVWTSNAVRWLDKIREWREGGADAVPTRWLMNGTALTAANKEIFDAANQFRGCLPGILEVLRRQGLVQGTWTLDVNEQLSPGQSDAIRNIQSVYPWLADDDFVAAHLDEWRR